MSEKEMKLRQIITDFEDRKIDGQVAVNLIQDLTGETIEIGYLSDYRGSESLDTFVDKLLVDHISDWENINDERAIELINEIQKNITGDAIILRNSIALEKRYGKPSGTVISKIFHEEIVDPRIILEELKKDTRIFL
jgi:hypothetical protein